MKNEIPLVVCKLPRAGLGNQLFPLMRAAVFAHLNNLPLKVINYHQLKLGPWLRNDRSKRNYNGFFTFQKNIMAASLERMKVYALERKEQIIEPDVEKINSENKPGSFLFSKLPHYTEYFTGLENHRSLVINLFNELIRASILQEINDQNAPAIGVHIRRGDFQKAIDEIELGKRGTLRTPLSFFIRTVLAIREMKNENLAVTVFSDGSARELADILKLPGVSFSTLKSDIADLMLLSRSKIIITSAGSTFSYWAGFLSEAAIIKHPTYTGIKIRSARDQNRLYEGEFDETNELMVKAIKLIN